MPGTYEIDWTEHPKLHEVDKFVADTFGRGVSRDFSGVYNNSKCVQDVKTSGLNWIEDRLEELEQLKELIEALPDDGLDKQTYLMDEDTDELIEQ